MTDKSHIVPPCGTIWCLFPAEAAATEREVLKVIVRLYAKRLSDQNETLRKCSRRGMAAHCTVGHGIFLYKEKGEVPPPRALSDGVGEGVAQAPTASCCEASAFGGHQKNCLLHGGGKGAGPAGRTAKDERRRGRKGGALQGTALARYRGFRYRSSERGASGRGEHTMLRRPGTSCDRAHGT